MEGDAIKNKLSNGKKRIAKGFQQANSYKKNTDAALKPKGRKQEQKYPENSIIGLVFFHCVFNIYGDQLTAALQRALNCLWI